MLNIAAYQIRARAGVPVGVLEWWTTSDDEIRAIKGFTYACHGDEVETSVVMATSHGRLVDLSTAAVNSPTLEALSPDELALYRAKIPFTRTLDHRWVGASGNMGDPTRASAEKGERIVGKTVEVGLRLLDVLKTQQPRPSGRA
jgi:creatinine amidohydrolase/Fe(II)-dependent formamide hydrolase-like protein